MSLNTKVMLFVICSVILCSGLSAQNREEAAMAPIVTLGEISQGEKSILQNRFASKLSENFALISENRFLEAQQKAFEVLDTEECTEENCIRKIQEFLQVERLFVMQIVREQSITQLSLTLVGLEERKTVDDLCNECKMTELYTRVDLLVDKLLKPGEPETVINDPQPEINQQEADLSAVAALITADDWRNGEAGGSIGLFVQNWGTQNLDEAQQFDADQSYRIGMIYRNGWGLQQDDERAFIWYQKAAEMGQVEAMTSVGYLYRNGIGVEQSTSEAIQWYQKAAEAGNAQAQYNIGGMYLTGSGVGKDRNKAVEWFQKAADNGYERAERALSYLED